MEHIGIDLGSRKSDICIVDDRGVVLERKVMLTSEMCAWLKARSSSSRVVLESCSQARTVAQQATEAGHEVWVIPGHTVRALGVGARGLKTDRRDAEVLAMASARNLELPHAWLRREEATELGRLCSTRASLVRQRTTNVNAVKSWFRERLWKAPGRNVRDFAGKVREAFQSHGLVVPAYMESLLATIRALSKEIQDLDQELVQHSEGSAVCKQLRSVPCVGPVTRSTFEAVVDDPHRFRHGDELASFLTLIPGERSTGGTTRRTGLIQAGPTYLRSLLIQCAWTLLRTRPQEPMVQWAVGIIARRGKKVGVVALARKLAIVLWTVWRRGHPYDPSKAVSIPHLEANAVSPPSPAPSARAGTPESAREAALTSPT